MKWWASKFTARHPNLVALEISSFKCSHDAPVYTVVERTVEQSGTRAGIATRRRSSALAFLQANSALSAH